ncbi:hypothetical protein CTEN210_01209 [Chaetoceros tenuissimus]|uniref:Uncharacterized protein n=1 Tax=Chaetoceros tenuissimus TaxID=426638 RepID=A0AAD3GZF9_9STRA|nr:hypothetical protein CTEN210_01209 [Chaetoceros tenuissimus]
MYSQDMISYSQYGPFAEYVKDSMEAVKRILAANRNPQIASTKHDHKYDDKFLLSQLMTNIGLTAVCNAVDAMDESGGDALQKAASLASEQNKSVTLRFQAKEKCEFLSEEEKEEECPISTEETTQEKDGKGSVKNLFTKRKVFNKVKLFHWKATIEYEIYLFLGNDSSVDSETSQVLRRRVITTGSTQKGWKENPLGQGVLAHDPVDLNLTWLIKTMDNKDSSVEFNIDRSLDSCRTPRFNKESLEAEIFFDGIRRWSSSLRSFFVQKENYFVQKDDTEKDDVEARLEGINGKAVFVPVLPLFEQSEEKDEPMTEGTSQVMLSNNDVELFLKEQVNSLNEAIKNLKDMYSYRDVKDTSGGSHTNPIGLSEAVLVLISLHVVSIADTWTRSIVHIEEMLMQQLNDAIGKRIAVSDLDEFVRFHNKRFFNETYAAEDFCYAVRRGNHYPDGLLSIEEGGSGNNAMTFTRRLSKRPMFIPINSATSIKFEGDLYAHAWMLQRYEKSPLSFNIIARARQFSSFLLVLGKISGSNEFLPENAIILQNKDEINIPLLLDELPSAQEFKDAIESLSPEQQAFAKAFRGMKLSSSVFGVSVIQLKPQLEVLLGLPDESLTKEVELTQDLMKLFVEYQIPSDLLSYDGIVDASPLEKVAKVKEHVNHIKKMIEKAKESELENAKQEAQMGLYAGGAIDDVEEEEASYGFRTAAFGCATAYAPPPTPIALASAAPGRRLMKKSKARCAAPKMMMKSQMVSDQVYGGERSEPTTEVEGTNEAGKGNNRDSMNQSEDNVLLDLDSGVSDFSAIPKALDSAFEKYTDDEKYGGTLRNVTLKTSQTWTKKTKPNILRPEEKLVIGSDLQKVERDRAYDLLDALSKSGALEIQTGELHMVVASCHSFEKSLVNTIIQDNINPIEKIERSNLIAASTIHGVEYQALLQNERDLKRLKY